jgi:GNAT superfamily N-acetyltransferase
VQADAPRVLRLFHELSSESRYHRFFLALNDLSAPMLRYLTEVDGARHVAIVAEVQAPEGEPRLVGVGRFARLPDDARAAEVAITVVDDMHRRGLGRRLLEIIGDLARHAGITRLTFEVKRSNAAMRQLLYASGARLARSSGSELSFEMRLSPPSAQLAPLRLLLAQVVAWRDFVARWGEGGKPGLAACAHAGVPPHLRRHHAPRSLRGTADFPEPSAEEAKEGADTGETAAC